MNAEQVADEFAENGLGDVADCLREQGVTAARKLIDARIVEEQEDDRLYHHGEGWVLGNLEVAREMLQ